MCRIHLNMCLSHQIRRVRHDDYMNPSSKQMNTPLVFMTPPPFYVADSSKIVPDCLKMLPDCLKLLPYSFCGGKTALFLHVAPAVVLLCLVLLGVVLVCLVLNGLKFNCILSYVVTPCLILSCGLIHTDPL
jgi:hypothetical protein